MDATKSLEDPIRYEVLNNLIKPIQLLSTFYSFNLRFANVKQRLEEDESLKIFLRFTLCNHESILLAMDHLPSNLFLMVNDEKVPLPHFVPMHGAMMRVPSPIDLTNYLMSIDGEENNFVISYGAEDRGIYYVAIQLVKLLPAEMQLIRLRNRNLGMAQNTKSIINREFSRNCDVGLITIRMTASLICPLTKCRIEVPGRFKGCIHLQCFDVEAFLKLNNVRETWKCPICNDFAAVEDLIIDQYFEEILNSDLYRDALHFEVDSEANYFVHKEKKENNLECIDILDNE